MLVSGEAPKARKFFFGVTGIDVVAASERFKKSITLSNAMRTSANLLQSTHCDDQRESRCTQIRRGQSWDLCYITLLEIQGTSASSLHKEQSLSP